MIRLDYRDSRPIYEQVRDGLRRLMVTGVMQPGEQLPSVRSLAMELAINPNTIQRAYAQLEQEGYATPCPAAERSWRRAVSRTGVGAASCASGCGRCWRSCAVSASRWRSWRRFGRREQYA